MAQDNGERHPAGTVTVVVIAPALGDDLQWISDVDPRVEVVNGSAR